MACWRDSVLEPRLEIYRDSLPPCRIRVVAPQEYNTVQQLGLLKDYLSSPTTHCFLNRWCILRWHYRIFVPFVGKYNFDSSISSIH